MGVNQYYMGACLPMGLSISCQTFERFSRALQWIMQHKYNASMSHIIDDFFLAEPSGGDMCITSVSSFLQLAKELVVPIKQSKSTYPTSRLPQEKLDKIRLQLVDIMKRKRVTLKQFQSLS